MGYKYFFQILNILVSLGMLFGVESYYIDVGGFDDL